MNQRSSNIAVHFLVDGEQPGDDVVTWLKDFIGAASQTLEVAIYDCALTDSMGNEVAALFRDAASRGVAVRIAYYVGPHHSPVIPPPVGSSDAFLQAAGVPFRPVTGFHALMHHKYVIRDADGDEAAVWTGSMNWTNDSWTREENIVLTLPSAQLASMYRADFEELWKAGTLEDTGTRDGGDVTLSFGGTPAPTRVWFSPGMGEDMAHAVAEAIGAARSQITIASPVLTEGSILAALKEVVDRGAVTLSGIYDGTQMHEVNGQWAGDPRNAWKIEAFAQIARAGHFSAKRSTPYGAGSVHDYMHMKTIVIDDLVFAGSYNFSRSGEENAENLLQIESAGLAEACRQAISHLVQKYGASST